MSDIRDGLSNTILAAEQSPPENGIPAANDLLGNNDSTLSTSPATCLTTVVSGSYSTPHQFGHSRFWAHGSPSSNCSIQTILPPNQPSCLYLSTVSSRHAGGAHVVMADGSVRFINNSINAGNQTIDANTITGGPSPYGIWGALGTAAGGEVVTEF